MRVLSRGRTHVVIGLFFIVALVCIVKLFYVQILLGSRYAERADHQYAMPVSEAFDRGTIFFTSKDGQSVSAATLRTGFKVAINPSLVDDPGVLFEKIQPFVSISKEEFIQKASNKKDPYEEIADHLDDHAAEAIQALNDPALRVYREKWRFYPAGTLASHVIGFMGYRGDEYAGRYGLERSYNDVLTRDDPGLYVNFFAQVFSDIGKMVGPSEKHEGDVVTTIEPSVQIFLENELVGIQKSWNPESGGALIMDPKTGKIIAMGAFPNFDPNTYASYDISHFKNPLIENVYEFGSIIKPLVMAAGLDVGAVTPETSYNDAGFVMIDGKKINNFDKRGRGHVTMQDVLNQSLNTGMVFVQQHMKKDDLRSYLLAYGLDEKTGIDLPNEASGIMTNIKSNGNVEFANASFGQGIAMTAIETARALSVLANGGTLVTPHVADRIDYPSGLSKNMEYPVGTRQLVRPDTSETITRMLVGVVDSSLGKKVKLESYSIAAKTGTAQIPNPSDGGYYTDRNLHSFFGYFPAYDPKFLVFLYVVHPQNGAEFAAQTLAPPFFDTTKFLLNYYNIPPDR